MKNLLLFITILAVFLSVNNIVFAQDYDSTEYLPEISEIEKQEKQPNKFKKAINCAKEGGQKIKQQFIETYHEQQTQNTRYNSSNYSNSNTRRDLADIVNRRSY